MACISIISEKYISVSYDFRSMLTFTKPVFYSSLAKERPWAYIAHYESAKEEGGCSSTVSAPWFNHERPQIK